MNEKKIKLGDCEVIYKYLNNEPIHGEDTQIDGCRALFVVKDNKGEDYKIIFGLSRTHLNSTVNGEMKSISEIIQEKYDGLENYFYKTGVKYIEEKIYHNNLKNEVVDIRGYL
jgi:hypothetical protein